MTLNETVKEAIMQSFIDLLRQKHYRSITISEIVEHRGVGRSSFYRNFKDKDDILIQYLLKLYEFPMDKHGIDDVEKLREFLIARFRQFRDSQDLFDIMRENHVMCPLNTYLMACLVSNAAVFGTSRTRHQSAFFTGAGIGMLVQWIEDGFKESEEELADIFIETMSGYDIRLKKAIENNKNEK